MTCHAQCRQTIDRHMARHLFLVSRREARLHEYLLERFRDDGNVEVILDMDCTTAVKGGVKALLEATQLSKVVVEYEPQQTADPAERLPDTRYSRCRLIDTGLSLKCTKMPVGVAIALQPSTPLDASVQVAEPAERRAGLFDALARDRGLQVVTFHDWKKIEQAEELAAREGAPREKFVDVEAMIRALG